jgi:predicted acetyltransferase
MADTQYYIPVVVEVVPASSDQAPVLANLFELYAHDMSEYVELELGADGRFGSEYLSAYWKDEGRYPFLIKARNSLAGFALVRRLSPVSGRGPLMDMAEFFVTRGFRRLGVGTKAACDIWKRFPGPWQIRVRDRNRPAAAFWAEAIEAFTGKPVPTESIPIDGVFWKVFSF